MSEANILKKYWKTKFVIKVKTKSEILKIKKLWIELKIQYLPISLKQINL